MEHQILTTEELSGALPELLEAGACFPLVVTGWSMRPLLRHRRDVVWLRAFHPETCKRGSILLYRRSSGRLVLHRVRTCRPDGYRMNGDAQTWCEEIAPEQVVAEAFQIVRDEKTIPCGALRLRLWDLLWFPTRGLRPQLFQMAHWLKTAFRGEKQGGGAV